MSYESSMYAYRKAMSGSLKGRYSGLIPDNISLLNDTTVSESDDIQNSVKYATETSDSMYQKQEDDRTWYQKTADFLLGVNEQITKGLLNFADSIGDFFFGVTASIADWAGNDEVAEAAKGYINTDWQSKGTKVLEVLNPSTYIAGAISDSGGHFDLTKSSDTYLAEQQMRANIFDSESGNRIYQNVLQGVGQALPSIGLAVATGGGSAAAQVANIAIQTSLGFVTGAGGSYSTAAAEDADMGKAFGYAMANGIISGVTSFASAKFGTLSGRLTNSLGNKVTDVALQKGMSQIASNVLGKAVSLVADIGFDVVTDTLQNALDPVLKQITYDSEAIYKAYGNSENTRQTLLQLGESAIVSASISVVSNAVNTANEVRLSKKESTADTGDTETADVRKTDTDVQETNADTATPQDLTEAKQRIDTMKEQIDSISKDNSDLVDEVRRITADSTLSTQEKENSLQFIRSKIAENVDMQKAIYETAVSYANNFNVDETTQSVNTKENVFNIKNSDTEANDVEIADNVTVTKKPSESLVVIDAKGEDQTSTLTALSAAIDYGDGAKVEMNPKAIGINDSDLDGKRLSLVVQKDTRDKAGFLIGTISDTTAILVGKKYDKANNPQYIFSNGVAITVGKSTGGIIDIAKATDTGLTKGDRYKKNTFEASRDYAYERYVKAKDSIEIARTLSDDIKNAIGRIQESGKDRNVIFRYNFTGFGENIGKAFNVDGSGKFDAISGRREVENLFNSKVSYETTSGGKKKRVETTLKNYLGLSDNDFNTLSTELVTSIDDILTSKSKISQRGRERLYYQTKIQRLQNTINDIVNIADINYKYNSLVTSLKNKARASKKPQSAASPYDSFEYSADLYDLTDKLRATKNGMSKKSLEAIVDHEFSDTFKTENPDIIEAQERLRNIVRSGGSETDEGTSITSKWRDYEVKKLAYNFLDELRFRESRQVRMDRARNKAERVSSKIDFYAGINTFSDTFNSNAIKKFITDARSPIEILTQIVGTDSDAYRMAVVDPSQDLSNQSRYYSDFEKRNSQIMEDTGYDGKQRNKRIKVNGIDDELTRGQLMHIYQLLNSYVSPDLMEYGIKYTNGKGAKKKLRLTSETIADIDSKLTDSEKAYALNTLSDIYNGMAKDTLKQYGEKHGLNIVEDIDNYIHINRGDLYIDLKNAADDARNITISGSDGIAKARTKNQQPIEVDDITRTMANYMEQVARYTNSDNIRKFTAMLNSKSFTQTASGEGNTQSVLAKASEIPGLQETLVDYAKSLNGYNTMKGISNSRFVGNSLGVLVSGNVGTWFKMFADAERYIPNVGFGNFIKGRMMGLMSIFDSRLRQTIKDVATDTDYYRRSTRESWAVTSNALSNNMSNFTKAIGAPLQFFADLSYKYGATPMAMKYVEDTYGYKIGTPENTAEAKNYLDLTARQVLVGSDQANMSKLRKGKGSLGGLGQLLFGTFATDSQAMLSLVRDTVFSTSDEKRRRQYYLKYANENLVADIQTSDAYINEDIKRIDSLKALGVPDDDRRMINATDKLNEHQMYKDQLVQKQERYLKLGSEKVNTKMARVKMARLVATLALNGVAVSLIDWLNQYLKGRGDDELENGEIYKNIGVSATIGWMPYISVIANSIKYNGDISIPALSGAQDVIEAFISIGNAAQSGGDTIKITSAMYDSLIALGYVTGLPVKSIMDYSIGAIHNLGGQDIAYAAQTLFKGYSSAYLSSEMKRNLNSGNDKEASSIAQANMQLFKTGRPSSEVAAEVARLSALPRDYMKEYNGVSLTSEQTDTFRTTYMQSNEVVQKLIGSSIYNSMSDESKRYAINKIYNAYYEASAENVTGEEPASRLGKVLSAVGNRYAIENVVAVIAKLRELGYTDTQAVNYIRTSLQSPYLATLALYIAGYSLSDIDKSRLKAITGISA